MSFIALKRFIITRIPLNVKIKGENNKVEYPRNIQKRKASIRIYGNNNTVIIKENCYLHNFKLVLGYPDSPVNDCYVEIGNNVNFNAGYIQIGEDNSRITIGDGSMFSFGTEMSCTDHHSILDEEGNLLNRGEFIEIGKNVWGCKNVTIMKNTKIPDDSILAANAVITKQFEERGSILAGNPAKQVKTGIHWELTRPNKYKK